MEIPYTVEARPDTGLYNAKLGIWLFLASEVMLFGALFSTYILLRVGAVEGYWPHGWLNVPIGTTNTLVLITSSITTVMAWASLKMNNFGKFKFYHACTILFALTFVGIKSYEYRDKFLHYEITMKDGRFADGHMVKNDPKADHIVISGHYLEDLKELYDLHAPHKAGHQVKHEHITIARESIQKMQSYGPWHNTYTAIYFTLTGLHALHVIGGAIVIGYLWFTGNRMWKTEPERFTNRVEVSGLFWHFVDLVWIFLFPVLYLL
jgi:cytochrome c oxidase subunit 3